MKQLRITRSLVELAFLTVLVVGGSNGVEARFAGPDIRNVPTDRILANLQRKVDGDPKNAQWHYELGRMESIAYATGLDSVQVSGYNPDVAYGGDTPPSQVAGTPGARKHLKHAIKELGVALQLAPDNLAYGLAYAWCLQQDGNRKEALRQYRAEYAKAMASEAQLKSWGVRQTCFACETSQYLIPLLDPAHDADEINRIKADVAKLQTLPRAITPIAIPLDSTARLVDIVSPSMRVRYDLDGTGEQRSWQWITPRAGWLVYDPHHEGHITTGLQLVGSRTFWVFWNNGYDALAAMDDNGDGVLSGRELDGLAVWQDANSNGICDPGEVHPLSELGIVSLSCQSQEGACPWNPAGVTFATGEHRPTWDWSSTSTP